MNCFNVLLQYLLGISRYLDYILDRYSDLLCEVRHSDSQEDYDAAST